VIGAASHETLVVLVARKLGAGTVDSFLRVGVEEYDFVFGDADDRTILVHEGLEVAGVAKGELGELAPVVTNRGVPWTRNACTSEGMQVQSVKDPRTDVDGDGGGEELEEGHFLCLWPSETPLPF
jgi:hypothetical protein